VLAVRHDAHEVEDSEVNAACSNVCKSVCVCVCALTTAFLEVEAARQQAQLIAVAIAAQRTQKDSESLWRREGATL
jgi:hypothetical protein